jgi:hypothetical protein
VLALQTGAPTTSLQWSPAGLHLAYAGEERTSRDSEGAVHVFSARASGSAKDAPTTSTSNSRQT